MEKKEKGFKTKSRSQLHALSHCGLATVQSFPVKPIFSDKRTLISCSNYNYTSHLTSSFICTSVRLETLQYINPVGLQGKASDQYCRYRVPLSWLTFQTWPAGHPSAAVNLHFRLTAYLIAGTWLVRRLIRERFVRWYGDTVKPQVKKTAFDIPTPHEGRNTGLIQFILTVAHCQGFGRFHQFKFKTF